jgi:hypothetical protein
MGGLAGEGRSSEAASSAVGGDTLLRAKAELPEGVTGEPLLLSSSLGLPCPKRRGLERKAGA